MSLTGMGVPWRRNWANILIDAIELFEGFLARFVLDPCPRQEVKVMKESRGVSHA